MSAPIDAARRCTTLLGQEVPRRLSGASPRLVALADKILEPLERSLILRAGPAVSAVETHIEVRRGREPIEQSSRAGLGGIPLAAAIALHPGVERFVVELDDLEQFDVVAVATRKPASDHRVVIRAFPRLVPIDAMLEGVVYQRDEAQALAVPGVEGNLVDVRQHLLDV